jgi:hypothetical protein
MARALIGARAQLPQRSCREKGSKTLSLVALEQKLMKIS